MVWFTTDQEQFVVQKTKETETAQKYQTKVKEEQKKETQM